jgi:hypothetical protein
MEIYWNRKTRAHLRKHQVESPEICPAFVERLLSEAHPNKVYSDRTHPWRHVFEGYFPPEHGRPYRVIFELDDQGGVWPVAAFRIRDGDYRKAR